jgi:hypothetical protein
LPGDSFTIYDEDPDDLKAQEKAGIYTIQGNSIKGI